MSDNTLIIGAGPAGMAAAMTLCDAGHPFTVVEKASQVGGLAKTLRIREGDDLFRTDIGPHRFFSKNPALYRFIEGLLDERWIEVHRRTQQYIDGKFFDYPINPAQALRNVGLRRAARMATDYTHSRVTYGLFDRPIDNFEDHIVAHFGRSLGELNMINYTEKIWGVPAATIHPDWASQRISGLSIRSAARDLLQRSLNWPRGDRVKTLVDSFFYPETGAGLVYEVIQDKVSAAGNPVWLESRPTRICHEGGRITGVELLRDGETVSVSPEHLVESIPITELITLLDPPPPVAVRNAAAGLRARSQVYLFLTLDKPSVSDCQWIYFPEQSIPFGRISEMRNFSDRMAPPGQTSLFVEFFCFPDEAVWSMSPDALLDLSLGWLSQMGFVHRHEVRQHYVYRAEGIYPIYDLDYRAPLRVIQDWLDQLENLHYIGRPGRFRYNNQDHSLEMGLLAAQGILEGRRVDLDAVGAGLDYYESGEHPESGAE
jgi:protoporphyrinogen oxidase